MAGNGRSRPCWALWTVAAAVVLVTVVGEHQSLGMGVGVGQRSLGGGGGGGVTGGGGEDEDNCVLSFVVPRHKVKTSCDPDQRLARRLSALETRVSLYKQHVADLRDQLAKERHRQRSAAPLPQDPPPASQAALEKRVQALEESLAKLRLGGGGGPGVREGRGGVGAGGEKALVALVTREVRREVGRLLDNYTHYVGRYVRDQALAFNHIISTVPRPQTLPQNVPPPQWPPPALDARPWEEEKKEGPGPQEPQSPDLVMLSELEGIRRRLNSTRERLATTLHAALKNVTAPSPSPPIPAKVNSKVKVTPAKVKVTTPAPPPAPSSTATEASGHSDSESLPGVLDVNDTTGSGDDSGDGGGESTPAIVFTRIDDNSSRSQDGEPGQKAGDRLQTGEGSGQQRNVLVPGEGGLTAQDGGDHHSNDDDTVKDAAWAQSRISHNNPELARIPEGGAAADADAKVKAGSGSEAAAEREWQAGMVEDEGSGVGPGAWVQEFLRTEMRRLLQGPVDDVVSLVAKHSALVDSRLARHHDDMLGLETRLTADIKQLDQAVGGLRLELGSVSEGLQALYGRTEGLPELRDTVAQLTRNVSARGPARNVATQIDEQAKKVRKLERLTSIYQQSLEHYRNKTKLEYRDLMDRMAKEGGVLRALNAQLYANVTQHASHLVTSINDSTTRQIDTVKQRVEVMENNSLLVQIDLSSLERQVKSKTSKAERETDRLADGLGDVQRKTRSLHKAVTAALATQEGLAVSVNDTARKVQQLHMEVKLNVLDDWLPYDFDYIKTKTDCFGEQFVRRSGFKTGRLVGVVLCSHQRYKIMLGQSLTDTFKNIGDDSGMGEDHCQFVQARSMAKVKVSPFRTSMETEPGYVRTHWGQEPKPELLNIIRPSPAWYECGVNIP